MKDVNDLMQAILEMDATQRRESEKAKLERTTRLAALDEQKQKIIAECDAREKAESEAAAKAHEADWCTELVQRALGGEAAQ